jgi:hypothetical protein
VSFLTPWLALAAAAVAIPLLLLLYFLKLRRRILRVPSTFLWLHRHEDLQANAPFQRLRYSALLALQLLLLLLLLLALAQPRLTTRADPAGRVVLLIDRSASMNAHDGTGRTRLDLARQTARDIVERLSRAGRARQAAVLSFARSAGVEAGSTSDRRTLLEAIDAIEATDGQANLAEALRLAAAFTGGGGEEDGDALAEVILLSDGGVEQSAEPAGFALQGGGLRFVRVGPDAGDVVDNLGIVAFNARRDYDDPTQVLVFARLLNAAAEAAQTVLTLRRDGAVEQLRRVSVPPPEGDRPGEATVSFAITCRSGARLELRHRHDDQLAADDVAHLVLPPPRRPRIALVSPGGPDPLLVELLTQMDPERLDTMSEQGYGELDPVSLDARERYDVVVFDRVSAPRLPGVPSITLGAAPAGVELVDDPPAGGQRLLTWERQHPVLRHVALDDLTYAGFAGYRLPDDAAPLAWGPGGPVFAQIEGRGARHVLVGFEPTRSNWPVQVSFAVFMQNAVDYLTLAGAAEGGVVIRPGDPIRVRVAAGADTLRIEGPGFSSEVAATAGQETILPELPRVGEYEVVGAEPPGDRVAVSSLSEVESDIRPRAEVTVNAARVLAAPPQDAAPRELWPWLLALAGLLLVGEWLVYCRQMGR